MKRSAEKTEPGRSCGLLLLTPPLLQTNCPYPATAHLTGYLRSLGYDVRQRDLSIGVVRDVLVSFGGDEAEELLELLSSDAPVEAKLEASAWMDDLARDIRDGHDPEFGFSRYAERIGANAADFGEIEKLVRRRGVMDAPLERRLKAVLDETRPAIVGVTCPFPGTLAGAFKIARWIKRRRPGVETALGGGFVSTELREMDDPRVRAYFDHVLLDEGYAPLAALLEARFGPPRVRRAVPAFVRPDYGGICWDDYFDVAETENPMHRLWSVGRWRKLQMARGCYWHRCAFCDVKLPYIHGFEMPDATAIVDAMAALSAPSGRPTGFHFVDEAMPPALVRRVCEEILRRGLDCRWWGNVRFDAAFDAGLCALMAEAGCIAVTGGLECACDRLLALMNKGITTASARRVLTSFRRAGIMVHAYLMYGFPTQTEDEAMAALDYVRRLFKADLVQSAFWHRFALTVHSPLAREPERFGIRLVRTRAKAPVFCRNEIPYREPGAPDWRRIGRALALAVSNYCEGRGLSLPVGEWATLSRPKKGGRR